MASVRKFRLAGRAVTLGALLAATAGTRQVSPTGCWRLTSSQWSPAISRGDESLYPLPELVELTSRSADNGYFVAVRTPARPPQVLEGSLDLLRAYWRPLPADSIELWLPTWWSTGIRARLAVSGDSLTGSAAVYVDLIGLPVPKNQLRGRKVRCRAA